MTDRACFVPSVFVLSSPSPPGDGGQPSSYLGARPAFSQSQDPSPLFLFGNKGSKWGGGRPASVVQPLGRRRLDPKGH